MLFPTHLLAAAVLGRLSRLSVPWLVLGSAVPDVVDKPLAMVGLTSLFHSVGHAAVGLAVVVPLALYSRAGLAAGVGWALHLLLDVLHVGINGRPSDALFLLWPVVVPPNPPAIPPGQFARTYVGTPSFVLELVFWVVVLAVFLSSRGSPSTS